MSALFSIVPLRGWLIIIGVIAAVGLAWWTAEALKDAGAQQAINKIETQDRSAVDAAGKARNVRRACVDGGGVWDTATGKCQGR
ncbi:hypothetical protein BA190_10335 [Labrys sp. WJW]|uniref:hypothetical protein n=1 Tax=Labrys sp. WJW TaxID=1737983 RepID=UPI00082F0675|nr:hypothetical protein [Labrys sp. WJW]OCC05292.1 hypothetical protein BA190_10335 [Labrys sp. WJW]